MKKSIRIAAALCAAVFALPVLAGCDFTNGDKSKDGDNSGVSGNGGAGENPFKGKTIEREEIDEEDYFYVSLSFASNTEGTYLRKYRDGNNPLEESKMQFNYSLDAVGDKTLLRIVFVSDEDDEKYFLQAYKGVSEKTRKLLVEREMSEFLYYEFGENDTIKINEHYYAGDIAKSREAFENVYDDMEKAYVEVAFRGKYLCLNSHKQLIDENGEIIEREEESYWGIPEFNGNDFTAEMYRMDGSVDPDERTYVPVGTIKGSYDIPCMTTTSKCSGTVSFTDFPGDMQGKFEESYSVQNWDARHDAEEHNDWEEYKIVAN
ncbi:MAG: hypothetical protein K2J50_00080 [Treponemataceae bacterium]|nr:hypothetical protein [Treponemataceae bacterium]